MSRATKSSALNNKSDVMQSEDIQCNYSDNTVIVLEFDCLNNVPKVIIQANKTGNLVSSDYDFLNSVFFFFCQNQIQGRLQYYLNSCTGCLLTAFIVECTALSCSVHTSKVTAGCTNHSWTAHVRHVTDVMQVWGKIFCDLRPPARLTFQVASSWRDATFPWLTLYFILFNFESLAFF